MMLNSELDESSFDLKEIYYAIKNNFVFIVCLSGIFSLIVLFYALSLPNIYKSEALLFPVQESSQDSLSSLANSYSGLASLAGVNIGGTNGSSNKTKEGIEILKSTKFLSDFIIKRNIAVPIIAAQPDKKSNMYLVNKNKYDVKSQKWLIEIPSILSLVRTFKGSNFTVYHDPKSGFIKITITHFSPQVAKDWVEWIVSDLNLFFKLQELDEAKKTIKYLEEELVKNKVKGLEVIFYRLIEEQTKKIMLANTRDEFLFRTIDPPVISDIKSSPRRALILIIGTFFGGMISLTTAFIMHFNNKRFQISITPLRFGMVSNTNFK